MKGFHIRLSYGTRFILLCETINILLGKYMKWRYARHRKSGNRGLWTLPHKKQGEHCKLSQLTALRERSGSSAESNQAKLGTLSKKKQSWEYTEIRVPRVLRKAYQRRQRELHGKTTPQSFKGSSQEFNRKKKEEWICKCPIITLKAVQHHKPTRKTMLKKKKLKITNVDKDVEK